MEHLIDDPSYYENPLEIWYSLGHTLIDDPEFIDDPDEPEERKVVVQFIADPVNDNEDDDEDIKDDGEDYSIFDENEDSFEGESYYKIRLQLKMVAWFYYKYFAFRHATTILKKLMARSRILVGLGYLDLTPLIAETEKLRDEYLAKHHSLIDKYKNNFTVDITLIEEEYGEPIYIEEGDDTNPEDLVKLITSAEFEEDNRQIIVNTSSTITKHKFPVLEGKFKFLPERLYNPLFREYGIAVGTLGFIYQHLLRTILFVEEKIDSPIKKFEKLFIPYQDKLKALSDSKK